MLTGHILPAIELAKLFVRHGFSVTIAIVDTPKNPKSAKTIDRLSASNPFISFHLMSTTLTARGDIDFGIIRDTNPALLSFLRSLPSIHAIIIDFLCSYALDVARELGIPAYFFYASGAFDLAVFLHLPVLNATTTESFKDMGDTLLHFPGVRPFLASGMPDGMSDRNRDGYKALIDHFTRHPKGDGILVNSFEWLEANACHEGAQIRALSPGPSHAARLLCRSIGGSTERGGETRVPHVAGCTTKAERRVPLLRQHGLSFRGAAQGDRHRAGAEQAAVLVGCAQPT